ncbi:SLATT domain-containing protein [Dasania sp. GY-19]|uniref:SLATT domain-containing protein n=1 Tax=Dasania phycosphaerae TaxID=2950436 RepID=A0A9J6RRD7_9GAMM|nr:SLATT domain-containing protein [Dasania phycosphaerae]MCZ0867147.1 SLATT domain-containing protein [Dasania phycosphaerae]
MEPDNLKNAVVDETHRIEEDALHSMKGHFNAGSLWGKVHLIMGIPSAILAGWAGIEAFSDNPQLTAILALLSAALTATVTFLKPQAVSDNHRNAGREYNKLKNKARRFREIELPGLVDEEAKQFINDLADQRDALNSMSPDIPRWAYNKAKTDIDEGRADYNVDVEKKNGAN